MFKNKNYKPVSLLTKGANIVNKFNSAIRILFLIIYTLFQKCRGEVMY